jgi:hypothetical protein
VLGWLLMYDLLLHVCIHATTSNTQVGSVLNQQTLSNLLGWTTVDCRPRDRVVMYSGGGGCAQHAQAKIQWLSRIDCHWIE